jgi:L,D-peptidoglycan transpeptidase YkuD (ErfK/YbiS/YcfS/YnhG family)
VKLPFDGSHEVMWRDDHLYDIVVILGQNDAPPVPGLGSAIFMHLAKEDYAPTEGCVALARTDLLALLARLGPGDSIVIEPEG